MSGSQMGCSLKGFYISLTYAHDIGIGGALKGPKGVGPGFYGQPSCCCCCDCWRTLRFVALNSFRIWHSHYFMFYAATLLDSFGNPTELARHFYVLSRLHILCPSAFSEPLMCLCVCARPLLLRKIYDPAQLRILQL